MISRPREGVYLAGAILFGMTILNTILLFILWSDSSQEPPIAELEDDTSLPAASHQSESNPLHELDRHPSLDNTSLENETSPSFPEEGQGAVKELEDESATTASRVSVEDTAVTQKIVLPPIEVRLTRPRGLESSTFSTLLEQDQSGLDRTLILLAAARWGEGLSSRAVEILRLETPALLEALQRTETEDEDLVLCLEESVVNRGSVGAALEQKRRSELVALELLWKSRWNGMIDQLRQDPDAPWRSQLASALGSGPVDLVILVDLSQSMSGEIEESRVALEQMIPELLSAPGDLRLGWIGYRDEVVDRCSLTSDGDLLVESLSRWHCEGGGDVTESLDEALFEAFRVGSFSWDTEAQHRFVVLGDAPPPYDRIENMLELARAAHASPERYRIDLLALIREREFPEIPSFRTLAEVTGGRCLLIEEGNFTPDHLWSVLVGEGGPRWKGDRP